MNHFLLWIDGLLITMLWVAFVVAVAVSFVGGVLIERVLFRPIHNAPVLSNLVAFIALFSILNSGAGYIWDFTIKEFPNPFGTTHAAAPARSSDSTVSRALV